MKIQIYENNQWIDLATLTYENKRFILKYDLMYFFDHEESFNFILSHECPLSLDTYTSTNFDFFTDLLPNGNAKNFWLKELGLEFEKDQFKLMTYLLENACYNPIGNIRILNENQSIKEKLNINKNLYFSLKEIASLDENFLTKINSLGGFSGSGSGAGGESLKFLLSVPKNFNFKNKNEKNVQLTNNENLELDKDNYIVKFSRFGSTKNIQLINNELMKLEYLYIKYLQKNNVNTIKDIYCQEEESSVLLWIKRFDYNNQGQKLGLQSFANILKMNIDGFYDHNEIIKSILINKEREINKEKFILDYLRQDMLRFFFGDVDNHLKNISMIINPEEKIYELAPMYDFSPMKLHFLSNLRNGKWKNQENGNEINYYSVINSLCNEYDLDKNKMFLEINNFLKNLSPISNFIKENNNFIIPIRGETIEKINLKNIENKIFNLNIDFETIVNNQNKLKFKNELK